MKCLCWEMENSWLCEIECARCNGAYKVAGKENYVSKGFYRNDTIYGAGMSNFHFEWLPTNRLFVMTLDGLVLTFGIWDVVIMINLVRSVIHQSLSC